MKSKARAANWNNTVDALRRKRQEDKIRKLEEEEVNS